MSGQDWQESFRFLAALAEPATQSGHWSASFTLLISQSAIRNPQSALALALALATRDSAPAQLLALVGTLYLGARPQILEEHNFLVSRQFSVCTMLWT